MCDGPVVLFLVFISSVNDTVVQAGGSTAEGDGCGLWFATSSSSSSTLGGGRLILYQI